MLSQQNRGKKILWQSIILSSCQIIIIASNGDYPASVDAVPKQHGTSTTESKLELLMRELDVLQEKIIHIAVHTTHSIGRSIIIELFMRHALFCQFNWKI